MTEKELREELFDAACRGRRDRFDELSDQLEPTPRNRLYVNLCSEMLNKHPDVICNRKY